MGMMGISMFLVGAVLLLNGLWLLGKADPRPVGFFNLLVGILCAAMAINNHFHAATLAEHLSTANTLLFALTYLMVAANNLLNWDGRALGWFCLYVAGATVPNIAASGVEGNLRLASIWLAWGILWYVFFLDLVRHHPAATRLAPYLSIAIGLLLTGLPGYLILWNKW